MYYDIIVAVMIFQVKAIIYSKVQTDFYKGQLPSVNYYIETGYVSVGDLTKSDNRLFYSLYLKENVLSKADIKDNDDVVLWIDGGPGCSSQYTNFNQNGPIYVDSDQQLHSRETAWNKLVHILYVDQPFGTGLSYWTKEEVMSSSWEAADYVIDLLKQYYNQNPEFKRTKLHIWGESYGGHYVPVLAEKIKKANLFNLVGIGIGGAWSHPEVQVSPTIQQLISYGVIDQHRQSIMMKQYTESFKLLENKEYDKYVLYRDVDVIHDYKRLFKYEVCFNKIKTFNSMFNQYVGPCDRYNILYNQIYSQLKLNINPPSHYKSIMLLKMIHMQTILIIINNNLEFQIKSLLLVAVRLSIGHSQKIKPYQFQAQQNIYQHKISKFLYIKDNWILWYQVQWEKIIYFYRG